MSFKSTNYRFASEKDLFAVYAILVTVSVITRKLHLYSQSRSPRRKISFCFIDTTFFTFGRYINVSFKEFLASNHKKFEIYQIFTLFTGLTQFLTINQNVPYSNIFIAYQYSVVNSFAYRIHTCITYICLRKKLLRKITISTQPTFPTETKKACKLERFSIMGLKQSVNS